MSDRIEKAYGLGTTAANDEECSCEMTGEDLSILASRVARETFRPPGTYHMSTV